MANIKHFSGETELENIFGLDNAKFAAAFPGVKGRRWDGFQKLVGYPVSDRTAIASGLRKLLPVERSIEYKRNPSKHACDARCLNATGRVMKCECSCGGKNHGKGAFSCVPVAA